MEKRSILDNEKGPIIIKTQIFQDGQVAVEITAIDIYRGKNVTIALGPKELDTLKRHLQGLRRAKRSERAKEVYKKRQVEK